jgi:hypothetical protein
MKRKLGIVLTVLFSALFSGLLINLMSFKGFVMVIFLTALMYGAVSLCQWLLNSQEKKWEINQLHDMTETSDAFIEDISDLTKDDWNKYKEEHKDKNEKEAWRLFIFKKIAELEWEILVAKNKR